MSKFKLRLFFLIAAAATAIFIRLGIWQLHRLKERRASNALITARLTSPAVDVRDLPRDTAASRFRRVRVVGSPDYAHELLWAARTHNGSPGVDLLTPVRLAGTDTAVLVLRGWVYAPDASTVDEAKWHDRDSTFVGFAEELPSVVGTAFTHRPRTIARLGVDVVKRALPYPVEPLYVVVLGDSTIAADRVARLTVPPLDEGPHFDYAMQWFGFALVTVVGVGVVFWQAKTGGGSRTVAPPPPPMPRDNAPVRRA